MDEDFSMLRGERRSFFCPNKLWVELQKRTKGCMSVSAFIRQAVVEKMSRDDSHDNIYFKNV